MIQILNVRRALAITLVFFTQTLSAAPITHVNSLLPVPSQVEWKQGALALSSNFVVAQIGVKDSRVDGGVRRFLARLEKRLGARLSTAPGVDSAKATLLIETKKVGLPVQAYSEDESYTLDISPTQARLSADNALGILHGLETLLQLVETQSKAKVLPAVTIQDTPRFRWRGLLMDVSRHWMPVETIKRNIDGLAAAKMNVLHWHLSEDQGFRIEVKTYPKLHGMGSDGNFYTHEQIKDVVAYARERGVRVVAEFDMPGHTTAWMVGYPELGSAPGPYAIERKFGVFDPAMDPTREEVFTFLDGFFKEVTTLFPDAYMHIGGDENNGKQWNVNSRIQAFMAKKGYKSNEDLQASFSDRVSKILTKYGKRMVGWDEILHPSIELPAGTVVHAWRDVAYLRDATKRGYDTILSNGYYLDLSLPIASHYLQDPIPADANLTAEQQSHVIGGEACMWSELVDQDNVDSRIWPRAMAVAERLWSSADTKDLPDLYRRLEAVTENLQELGLKHRSHREALLKDLAGDKIEALRLVADATSPLQRYKRHGSRVYLQSTPLNRLVDAVEPDGPEPRRFNAEIDALLVDAPMYPPTTDLEALLKRWSANHKELAPAIEKSERLIEITSLSMDLSALAQIGAEALQYVRSGKPATEAWVKTAEKMILHADEPRAELNLTVLPGLRKLVYAAASIDKVKMGESAQWIKDLEVRVEKATPKRNPW